MFATVFSGNSRENLQAILANKAAFGAARQQLVSDLGKVQVVTNQTDGALRNFTSVEKFRIMGHVWSEEINRGINSLITMGKQAQWVGRQMIVGLSIPLAIAGSRALETFLRLNKAQTELAKYLQQTGLTAQQTATLVNDKLAPAFENIATQTGLYIDEVNSLAAGWVAAGATLDEVEPFTKLTGQLQMIGQGEIDMSQSMELIRSVSRTFNLSIADTTDEIQKLTLVAGETALTLGEITEALPLASTAASGLGLSASELAVSLGAMRDQGVQANAAANTLKFSINRLVNPTQTAVDAFKELTGLELKPLIFTPEGEGRGVEALQNIAETFSGAADKVLTSEEQLRLAGQLFGGYRADKMLKLFQSINQEGSAYNKTLQDIQDQEKALAVWEDQLNVVRESAAFQWQQLRVQFSYVIAKIGKELVPYALKLGDVILGVLKKFDDASESSKKFAIALAGIAAAIGPVVYILAQLGLSIGTIFKGLVGAPLKAMFGLKSAELPLERLLELAEKTRNPVIGAAAGLPISTQELVKATDGYQTQLAEVMIQLGQENALIQTSVVQANELNTAKLAQLRIEESISKQLLQQQYANEINAVSGLHSNTSTELRAVQNGILDAQSIYRSALGGDTAAEGMLVKSLGLTPDNTTQLRNNLGQFVKTYRNQLGEITTLEQAFYASQNQMLARETLLQRARTKLWGQRNALVKESAEALAKQAAASKVATLEQSLATTIPAAPTTLLPATPAAYAAGAAMGSNLIAGTEEGIENGIAVQGPGIVTKLKAWFLNLGKAVPAGGITALGNPGTQGSGLFSLLFGSPLKTGALVLGAAGIAKFLPDIMRGWAEDQAKGLDILSEAFQDMVQEFQKFFGENDKISSVEEAFESLGKMIGKIFVAFSKLTAFMIRSVVPTLDFLSDVVGRIVSALLNLLKLNFTDFFKAWFGGWDSFLSVSGVIKTALVTIGAVLAAFFAVNKIRAIATTIIYFVESLMTTTTAATGVKGALQAMSLAYVDTGKAAVASAAAQKTAAASSEVAAAGMASMASAITAVIAVAVVLITVIAQMSAKTDAFADAWDATSDQIQDSFIAIGDAATSTKTEFIASIGEMEAAFESFAKEWAKGMPISDVSSAVGSLFASQMNNGFLQAQIDAAPTQAQLDAVKPTYGPRGVVLSGDAEQYAQLFELKEKADAAQIELDKLRGTFDKFYDHVGYLSKKNQGLLLNELKAWKSDLQGSLIFAQSFYESNPTSEAARERVYALRGEIDAANAGIYELKGNMASLSLNPDLISDSALHDALGKLDDWAKDAGKVGKKAGLDFKEEFQSQLQNFQSEFVSAIEEAFDNVTDARVQSMQDSADAQVDAIQKQIDAIEEQNAKEEWLQQQREYRQQREDLLNQKNLDSAIAARQQLIQYAQGNFDEGVLIGMEAKAKTQDTRAQLRDLDRQHSQDVEDRREEQLIDSLKKQQDSIEETAQANIDKYQEMRDAQAEFLSNTLDDLSDFIPKNKRQWERWQREVGKSIGNFGVSLEDVNKVMLPQFGYDLETGLQAHMLHAQQIAAWGAGNLGAISQTAFQNAKAGAYNAEDIHLYDVLRDFLSKAASGNLSAQELSNWMGRISAAMSDASSKATANADSLLGGTAFSAFQSPGGQQLIAHGFHTGGMVPGRGEVPAKLLSGEFVVQRDAVKQLGVDNLERINNSHKTNKKLQVNEYHEGGYVGSKYAAPYAADVGASYAAGTGVQKLLGHTLGKVASTVLGSIYDKYFKSLETTSTFTTPGESGDAMFIDGVDRLQTPIGYVTPPTYNYWEQANSVFNGLRNMGAWVIKKISGSDSWSQHSYGNAIDVGSSVPTMGKLWEWGLGNRSALRLENLIYNRQIWNEGGGIHPYTGDNPHTDHVHADFVPPWAGYPGTYDNPAGYPTGGAPAAPPISAQTGTTSGSNTPSETGNVDQRLYSKTPASQKLAQSYGHAMMLQKWGESQWSPLQELWNRESAWRWWAENTGSGAYGIPQSLPGSKMASAGNDWRTNALTQIKWGLGYIGGRYGSPQSALNHSDQYHWYHSGGMVSEYPGKNIVTADDGALFKRRQLANVAPNELAIPLDNPNAVSTLVKSLSRVAQKNFNGIMPMNDLRFNNPRPISNFSVNPVEGGRENLNVQHDNSATINMSVNIDQMFGDENSYRRLAETLEKVGNRMARERGAKNISIRYDG